MNITSGKIQKALKVVIYGPEGIGKSTFAAQFPDPLFIDTEGSTTHMDVRRFDAPTSWQMLLDEVRYVIGNPTICRTLVIDTADWAEKLCIDSVLALYKKNGVEDFGYGKGYVYIMETFGKLLDLLTEVIDRGVNVVITAHAKMRKFEQPDEMGAYDRWEMKLSKQVAPIVKEWADMVLFATYKTIVVKEGTGDGAKNKAQGGRRVMYTAHHPCWDAKNRHGLAEELPFEYKQIAHIMQPAGNAAEMLRRAEAAGVTVNYPTVPQPGPTAAPAASTTTTAAPIPAAAPAPASAAPTAPAAPAANVSSAAVEAAERAVNGTPPNIPPELPRALRDLMERNGIDERDIRTVVANAGYKPFDMPIKDYGEDFINGALIAGWEQMLPRLLSLHDLF